MWVTCQPLGNRWKRSVTTRAATAKVPIVIMTGKGTPADWQTLSRLGANALLVKPFDSTHAIALLRALIDVPHKAKAP